MFILYQDLAEPSPCPGIFYDCILTPAQWVGAGGLSKFLMEGLKTYLLKIGSICPLSRQSYMFSQLRVIRVSIEYSEMAEPDHWMCGSQ